MLCVSCQWFASNCCWGEWGPLGIRVNCVSWNTRRLVSLYIAPYDMPLQPRRLIWIPKYAIFEGRYLSQSIILDIQVSMLIFRVAIAILKETGCWFRLVCWLGVIWEKKLGIWKFLQNGKFPSYQVVQVHFHRSGMNVIILYIYICRERERMRVNTVFHAVVLYTIGMFSKMSSMHMIIFTNVDTYGCECRYCAYIL